jgi:hypothetical protein
MKYLAIIFIIGIWVSALRSGDPVAIVPALVCSVLLFAGDLYDLLLRARARATLDQVDNLPPDQPQS